MYRYRLIDTNTWISINTHPIFAANLQDAAKKVSCALQLVPVRSNDSMIEYAVYNYGVKVSDARLERIS